MTPSDTRGLSLFVMALRKVWFQILLLLVVLSGHVVLEWVPEHHRHPAYAKAISFAAVWIVVWCVTRVLSVARESRFAVEKLAPNLRTLVFIFLKLIVYSFGFLFALDALGVSITPLLASLGVGSLAVGLALQDTLGNLFSGFYLYLDRPITIGDWIRHESGVEGKVTAIGWRSTRLLVGGDNSVIIPNSKLSTAIVTNYSQPTQTSPFSIVFSVPYEADLNQVEEVVLGAAKKLVEAQPAVYVSLSDSVQIRFQQFTESGIEAVLSAKVRSFQDVGLAKHELIKEIQAALSRARIAVAYPVRVVHQAVTTS